MADVPQVAVAAVNLLPALLHRDAALLGIVETFSRDFKSHSRHGAITFNSGASA